MSATSQYRHFDGSGKLLYVGIARDPFKHLGDHKQGARWRDQIVHVDIERHPTRDAALEAERIAIRDEKPECNVMPYSGVVADDGRDKPLRIWVTAEMRETIKKLAEADRRPVSTWIMMAIERAIEEAKRKK
jgi:hypothetical protein